MGGSRYSCDCHCHWQQFQVSGCVECRRILIWTKSLWGQKEQACPNRKCSSMRHFGDWRCALHRNWQLAIGNPKSTYIESVLFSAWCLVLGSWLLVLGSLYNVYILVDWLYFSILKHTSHRYTPHFSLINWHPFLCIYIYRESHNYDHCIVKYLKKFVLHFTLLKLHW